MVASVREEMVSDVDRRRGSVAPGDERLKEAGAELPQGRERTGSLATVGIPRTKSFRRGSLDGGRRGSVGGGRRGSLVDDADWPGSLAVGFARGRFGSVDEGRDRRCSVESSVSSIAAENEPVSWANVASAVHQVLKWEMSHSRPVSQDRPSAAGVEQDGLALILDMLER